MKMILIALAMTAAAPAAAQAVDPHAGHASASSKPAGHGALAADPHAGHKDGCCDKAKDGKMACCDKTKRTGKQPACCNKDAKQPAGDLHAGHDMSAH